MMIGAVRTTKQAGEEWGWRGSWSKKTTLSPELLSDKKDSHGMMWKPGPYGKGTSQVSLLWE